MFGLGAAIALKAMPRELTEAYSEFKQEALRLDASYAPQTVNYDGWEHTQRAWVALFPAVVIIRCFLHAFLRIRDRCKRLDTYPLICHLVWRIYHATCQTAYYRDFKRLLVFAETSLSGEPLKAIVRFKAKRAQLAKGLFYPGCHRVSTMLNRHMQSLTRCLYMARDFHGHRSSAHLEARLGTHAQLLALLSAGPRALQVLVHFTVSQTQPSLLSRQLTSKSPRRHLLPACPRPPQNPVERVIHEF